jgi:hypothetical protein
MSYGTPLSPKMVALTHGMLNGVSWALQSSELQSLKQPLLDLDASEGF